MSDKPNILFILADDMGAWAMGCAGNHEVITPNLDRLASSGIRFENFFCTSPVCSPSRASILTGLMPSRHGIHDWLRSGNIDTNKLNDNQRRAGWYNEENEGIEYIGGCTAYTEILAEAGYSCAMSGKWHLGNSHRPQKGFTRWNVLARGGCNYYGSDMASGDGVYNNEGYITDTITNNALGFLDEMNDEQPFYLSVHYTSPHTPWNEDQHPADIWSLYNNCPFDSAPSEPPHKWQAQTCQIGRTEEERCRLLHGYYTAITAMDHNIGRLLNALEKKNLTENTLVVFMGDNGMNLGHHGIWGKGNGTFPLNMYDTSVKVPCMMSQPGKISAGLTCDALLSQYDFMPTLLEYTGNADKIPAILPGHSFFDLLKGESKDRENRTVYVFDEYGPVRMIRDTHYKYIHRYPYGEHELYDLLSDPGERINLAGDADYDDITAEYKHKLDLWFLIHVNPEMDGSREAVTGFGQMGLAGIKSGGYAAYRK